MEQECLCDGSSDFSGGRNRDEGEEMLYCNRIFLNFTRECRHPAKDRYNLAKAKDLFNYLSERQDLQEMKVSGWLEEGEPNSEAEAEDEEEEDEEEEEKDVLESYFEDRSTPRGGGQRFAMSRDFWYRKLNTLKARKLDEVALEARDLPPDDQQREPKNVNWLKNQKVFAAQIPESGNCVLGEMDLFDRTVAKPAEKELRKRFVNVYDNRKHFTGGCN